MQTKWVKGFSAEEAEKFKKSLLGSKIVLDKLKEMCYNDIIDLDSVQSSDFDSPNWALKRAYEDGKKAALRDIINLCNLDQRQPKTR